VRQKVLKSIVDKAKKTSSCPFCESFNGTVRKIPPLKLVHEKYTKKNDAETRDFHLEFDYELAHGAQNSELK